MRKTATILLIVFSTIVNAQTEVTGVWKMTEMTVGGEKIQVNMPVDFNINGKLYISGREFGTWDYNKTKNILTASADMQLEIMNGINKIGKINNTDMVLINPKEGDVSFKRISLPFGQTYNNDITGEYIFSKIIIDNKTLMFGDALFNFDKNGIVYSQEMILGTWEYNKNEKEVIIDAPKVEEFNGSYTVEKSGKELIIDKKSAKLFFEKLNFENIYKHNIASGLIGLWQINADNSDGISLERKIEEVLKEVSEEGTEEAATEFAEETKNREIQYLAFKSPDLFSYGTARGGSKGIWIYNKNKTITFIGSHIEFGGENEIVEIDNSKFVFKNKKGQQFSATKIKQDAKEREALDYKEEDFFTVTENSKSPKLEIDNSKIPWNDYQSNINYLKAIKSAEYEKFKLIERFEVFEKTKRIISIDYNQEDNSIQIDNLLSNSTYAEKIRYIKNRYNENHPFIIIEEILSGKIIGQENVTTPAGTFECTVVEGYSDYDDRIKLWMINDKPGIYAKIIKIEKDVFDDMVYSMYILNKIME